MDRYKLAKSFKIGDEFYEADYGYKMKFKVSVEPTTNDSPNGEQVRWEAIEEWTNQPTSFLITKGFERYGPKIYPASYFD